MVISGYDQIIDNIPNIEQIAFININILTIQTDRQINIQRDRQNIKGNNPAKSVTKSLYRNKEKEQDIL